MAKDYLGLLYVSGRGGLPQDEQEAMRLFKLAADQGEPNAQIDLGDMYEKGQGGLPKDEREAARLYKLAADQGSACAQCRLAWFYWTGCGGLPKAQGPKTPTLVGTH